jgi:hypothetical protein
MASLSDGEGTVRDDDLGEILYNAYRDEAGGRSIVTGDFLPDWSALDPRIQAGWVAAWRAGRKAVETYHGDA